MQSFIKKHFKKQLFEISDRGKNGMISKKDGDLFKRNVELAMGLSPGTLSEPGKVRETFMKTVIDTLASRPSASKKMKMTPVISKPKPKPTSLPRAMLAHKYNARKHADKKFWASEKLDGIRAMFYDGVLYTRGSNPVRAPSWFIAQIPAGTFDGELFGGRGKFQETSSIVMGPSTNPLWSTITYKIFDDWNSTTPFSETYENLSRKLPLCSSSGKPSVCLEPHKIVKNNASIQKFYDIVSKKGGEGLMLRSNVPYRQGSRSNAVLKVKKMQDAEAKIVGFEINGGIIKSLICTWINSGFDRTVTFKVGSGLTDSQRNPKSFKIGNVITVQYFEITKSGKPRHPVFKGIRKNLR